MATISKVNIPDYKEMGVEPFEANIIEQIGVIADEGFDYE